LSAGHDTSEEESEPRETTLIIPQSPPTSTTPLPDSPAPRRADRSFLLHLMAKKLPIRSPRLSANAFGVVFLLALGTLAYAVLEDMSVINAVYLSTCVITSVGLTVVPHTVAGKLFTVLFNVASLGQGILLLVEIADWRRERMRRMMRSTGAPAVAWDAAALLALALPTILGAAIVFQWLEGWKSLGEALYFCIIISTGLGLGDVEPRRPVSRLFMCAYLPFIMGVVLHLLGLVGNVMHEGVKSALLQAGFAPADVVSARAGGGSGGGLGVSPAASGGAAAPRREHRVGGKDHADDINSSGSNSGGGSSNSISSSPAKGAGGGRG
jgi:hypothetical protein